MLEYVLHSNLFSTLLLTIAYINIILNNNVDSNKTLQKIDRNVKFGKFKRKVLVFYSIILFSLMIFIFIKFHTIYIVIIGIATIKAIHDIYINIVYDSLNLSIDSKKMYTFSTFLIYVFLSSKATDTYIQNLLFLPHILKEVLLLLYLNIKTMTFIFLILINFSILVSNIKILYKKISNKLISKMNILMKKKISFKLYDFYFYKKYKNNFTLIIDKLIYIITLPILVITISILYVLVNIFRFIIKIALRTIKALSEFDSRRDIVIKQVLRITLIISLVIVFIISIYSKNIFSTEIIDIYSLITTVILIPIIYDEIKLRSQKRKEIHNENN